MDTITVPETESQKLIMETVQTIRNLNAAFDDGSCEQKEWFGKRIVGVNMDEVEALVVEDKSVTKKREMSHAADLEQVSWMLILKLKKLPENQSGKAKELLSKYDSEYEENLAHREQTVASIEKQYADSKNQAITFTHERNKRLFDSTCDAIIEEIERTP